MSLGFLLLACTPPPVAAPPFYLVPGTAVGDPCTPNGMFIDTPRGFPRVCLNGRWAPWCEETVDAELRANCEAYAEAGVPEYWR